MKTNIDLSKVSDDDIKSEWARRNSKKRLPCSGGRPPVMNVCPFCTQSFRSFLLRAHLPNCRLALLKRWSCNPVMIRQSLYEIKLVNRETLLLVDGPAIPISAVKLVDHEKTRIFINGSISIRDGRRVFVPPAKESL